MTHEYDLTEQSDLDMLDEVDGEYYNWDQNHSGYLWLTDECVDKYGLERGIDVEPIDWNIWNDDDDLEMRDKGFKWDFHIQQYASVHTKDGKYLRDCTYEDWEVCKANGIKEEMLSDPGCEIMGWCDG
tara:strand:- start:145 stop:528 length:384 start_codon:yes stop_codon:yes gene_type:complete